MSVAARKSDALAAEFGPLFENYLPVDEFTARRVIRECTAAIADASLFGRAQLFGLIGNAWIRLGHAQKALEAFQAAIPCDPAEYLYRGNAAACLANLGRWADARRALDAAESLDMSARQRVQHFGNAAEVAFQLGERATAASCFAKALAIADPTHATHLFLLSVQAAAIDRPSDAVELLARYVALVERRELGDQSAVDVIRSAQPDTLARARELPELMRAVTEEELIAAQGGGDLVPDLDDAQKQRLADVLAGPQEPTPALRALLHGRRA
ncbi:MAG: hypothetical protein J0L92_25320 [Deltaproteobacteria bacterium]|nr:hypothetical protein [Deltaproteobacteria bacterium]